LLHIGPDRDISAGSRLHGGPFVVEVLGDSPLEDPPPRPPARSTLTETYVHRLNLVSLGYAALRFVMTRSLSQALEAMMLVNPRPALVGADMASIAANSRAMKAGVVVVGTRPRRHVRQPDVVIMECVRMLVEGYELTGVLSLGGKTPEEILARATGVSLACGSPWGSVLPAICEVLAGGWRLHRRRRARQHRRQAPQSAGGLESVRSISSPAATSLRSNSRCCSKRTACPRVSSSCAPTCARASTR